MLGMRAQQIRDHERRLTRVERTMVPKDLFLRDLTRVEAAVQAHADTHTEALREVRHGYDQRIQGLDTRVAGVETRVSVTEHGLSALRAVLQRRHDTNG